MKTRFALTGISLLVLIGTLHAENGTGFPPLSSLPNTGQLQDQPGATKFRFIVAGDNRPATDTPTPSPVLTQILSDVVARKYQPVFFLWAGDIVYGHHCDGATLQAQYEEFFKVAALGKAPVFNSPGNHEMDSILETETEKIETPDPTLQGYYVQFTGAQPYGAFNYGNSRFIAVDTEEPGGPGASPTCTPEASKKDNGKNDKKTKLDPGFVSPAQIALLTSDLEANKGKAHIFIFMHHPIKPAKKSSGLNRDNAKALEALFKNYPNVSYVIAAHEHLFYNASGSKQLDRDGSSSHGPTYLVSGGAGARLDKCPDGLGDDCKAQYHYLVFDVDGSKVDVKVGWVDPKNGD